MKELSELTAPAEVNCKLLEADVQKKCVDWARARGYWARKFSSISQRSVPDYLFSKSVLPVRNHPIRFATEFKREGAPIDKQTGCMSTKAQVEEQEAMREAGWRVFECDNFEAFKRAVFQLE